MKKTAMRNIVLLWLAWVLIVIGFQALSTARFQPQWPAPVKGDKRDPAKYQEGHPYLLEPFMNNQVGWDSEPYLGISIGGYEDQCISVAYLSIEGTVARCMGPINRGSEKPVILSYAYFPIYPIMIHLFAIPLRLLGLNPIATATLAGVVVSALGTLAAMLALYDLTYEALGEDGAMRAVFYLLIFPTSFFFVQVYTEGLFVGLAFGSLVMLKRNHLAFAALLAAVATLTRAVGVTLVIPMAMIWIRTHEWYALDLEWNQLYFKRPPWRPIWHALLAFTPLLVFLVWKFSYFGAMFNYVETLFFSRGSLDLGDALRSWATEFSYMVAGFFHLHIPGDPHDFVPLSFGASGLIEFFCIAIGFITILRALKTDPEVAWFSLAAFLIPLLSGPPSIERYMLAAPAVFITLARWGKNPVFDRVWTVASLLLMGLLAMLFAFNFWVA